jgi:hypothetical protein
MRPTAFYDNSLRSAARNFQEHRREVLETFWEVRKYFRRNLSLAALRPQDARDS